MSVYDDFPLVYTTTNTCPNFLIRRSALIQKLRHGTHTQISNKSHICEHLHVH